MVEACCAARLRRLGRDERGSITILGLFLFLTCCMVGAAALDVTHFYAARTQLQAAADLAAHAALHNRGRPGVTAAMAKSRAIAAVQAGMDPTVYGHVLTAANVTFGTWDQTTRTFAADPASLSAVRVVTGRNAAGGNPVPSFLFRLVGVEQVDVETGAVFASIPSPCLSEGFVAKGRVDMQSNNDFRDGFCIHSNDHVEFNQNNDFETGVTVSMPNTANLVIPASGFRNNPGLEDALRSDRLDLNVLDRLAEVVTGVSTMGTSSTPSYLTSASTVALGTDRPGPTDFTSGRVHTHTCSDGKGLTFGSGTYQGFVLVATNCEIKFGRDVILQDVVVSTTSTSSKSISSTSDFQIGRNDNCADGGGAHIITRGGVSIPAKLNMFGGQIIAGGDVEFRANANGIMGASIIAGGEIDGTSNTSMGRCGTGMESLVESGRLRLVR